MTIPLYPSYLMRNKPQNTIYTIVTKNYNDFHSVRIEALEWLKKYLIGYPQSEK